MPRILAIDYGQKRTGIAVTDPLQIISTGLKAVDTKDLFSELETYFRTEDVETIVVGYPTTMQNEGAESLVFINPFIEKLIEKYPDKKVVLFDERFTSKLAQQAILAGGIKKMQRRDKYLTDKISAVIILQSYMERISNTRI